MTEIAALSIKVESQQTKAASAELDKLTSAGARAEKSTKQLETATDRLQRSMLDLKGVVGGLATAFGAYKIATYIKDSALLAARYETLGVTMQKAGANAGYTKGEMDSLESSLRAQGIAGVEARQTLTRLAAANMDLSKASAMARAAQDLAVVANINSSEAFERLVRGIQSGETEILKTLGLNVQFDKSYKDMAKSLKVNADQLTEAEKTQARMNVTLEAAKGYAGLYEGAMDTAGKQINSLKRYTDDLAVSFGTAFNTATASIVKDITNSVKDLSVTVKDPAFQMGVTGIGQFGANLFGAITYGGTAALQVLGNTMSRISGIFIMVDGFLNKHQEDIETGRKVLFSGNPAKALQMAGADARDRALTYGATQTGQVLAPGALEAEFNIQSAGRNKGPVVREQSQAQIEKALRAIEKANEARREAVKSIIEANDETRRSTANIQAEIDALEAVSGLYGEAYGDRLTMLRAAAQAQDTYNEALKKGVTMENAAAQQAATLAKAQAEITARKQQAGKSLASGFSGPAYEAERNQLIAAYDYAKQYTTDRVAMEAELQRKLANLESARLKKTENPYDGLKAGLLDYTESVGTASSRMADLMSKGFKGAEDALSQMVGKGKVDLMSLFDLMRVEAARSMVVQPLLGGFASALKGFNFASLFNANANGNAFGPGGVYAFASGGVVSSPTPFRFGAGGANLGIMGEAGPEAIMPLKRGSDGKLGVSADGKSGSMPITVKLVNQSGQQLKASTAKVSQDSQGMIVEVFLDAWARDVGGMRTTMQGGR